MVLPDGWPTGMKRVLEEHGVDTENMKAADMRSILGGHKDLNMKNYTWTFYSCWGHRCYYIPVLLWTKPH